MAFLHVRLQINRNIHIKTQLFGNNINIECRMFLLFNNKVVNVIERIHLSIQE